MKKIIWFTNHNTSTAHEIIWVTDPNTSTAWITIDGENVELFDSTHREDGGEKCARRIDCNSSSDYEKERKLMNRINTDNSTSQQT